MNEADVESIAKRRKADPANLKTLDEVVDELKRCFGHPSWRFEGYVIRGVTTSGGRAKLGFDARLVGRNAQ